MNKDLFSNEIVEKPVTVNIYADEVQSKICKDTNNEWHYIGLIVENVDNPLLKDIIHERYMGNFDQNSPYYSKNNRIVHWSEIRDADTKNICKRWFEYILSPTKSKKKFYSYILGINNSLLSKEAFDPENQFMSKYNRFFRAAIIYALKTFFGDKYALKTFFGNKKIIVENIYHEEGQQKNHKYFPWHCIYKINTLHENIEFKCNKIIFLPKDHKKNELSNLIQLCDCLLGVTTSIIHSFERSKRTIYREELCEIYLPLLERLIHNPDNKNSSYKYYKRILIRFFPKEKIDLSDPKECINQFYTKRNLKYIEDKSGQTRLF